MRNLLLTVIQHGRHDVPFEMLANRESALLFLSNRFITSILEEKSLCVGVEGLLNLCLQTENQPCFSYQIVS